jgi:glycogen debranching enzyme
MDAKIGDWVVTPRQGKPVEINALWYSNLRIMMLVAQRAGDAARAAQFAAMAARAETAFKPAFWNEHGQCLHDVVSDQGKGDGLIRPNQCIAVSVPFSPIDAATQKAVITAVQKVLLTPMGLRTLAPGSPGYHGRCAGDQRARDMAYHQGTVWPWLIGPFVSGYVKVHGNTPSARKEAMAFIEPFKAHLRQAGLGSISEIADAEPPHTPRGCPAQAWSVAEVFRAYWEDILAQAPAWPHESAAPAAPAERSALKV